MDGDIVPAEVGLHHCVPADFPGVATLISTMTNVYVA